MALILVSKILPNPEQPRKNFDEQELQELAKSMAKSEKEQVEHLVHCGSVESLKDTLGCDRRGYYSQGVLLEALRRFEAGGQKTKALLIERALKKLAKVKHE